MDWIPVQSRLLSSAAYDAKQHTLFVRLKNRSQKIFRNIEPETFNNLVTAESPGFYYSCYIDNGTGEVTEVRPRRAHAYGRMAAIFTIAFVFLFTADVIRHSL